MVVKFQMVRTLYCTDPGMESHCEKCPQTPLEAPQGEVYFAVEGARGKIGVYLISNGDKHPYRVKLRSPGFSNLSLFGELATGYLLQDAVSILGSLDLVIPEIDR